MTPRLAERPAAFGLLARFPRADGLRPLAPPRHRPPRRVDAAQALRPAPPQRWTHARDDPACPGIFIKVGQILSIPSNFLPPEFRAEPEKLFRSFDPVPVASVPLARKPVAAHRLVLGEVGLPAHRESPFKHQGRGFGPTLPLCRWYSDRRAETC